MSYLTPSNALIALVAIIGLIGLVGLLARLFLSEQPLTPAGWLRGIRDAFAGTAGTHSADDYQEDHYDSEYDDEEEAVEIDGEPKEAVEMGFTLGIPVEIGVPFIGPPTFEIATMTLRLTAPHLFADDWFKAWKADFSQWSVNEARKRAQWRRRMGLAT